MALSTINAAVHRQDSNRTEALLDRLFALWFTRFVYNQIWEDPEVDLAALAINPACRVVTIASGGCNVLSYLTADPAAIVAVDLNPAHTALTRLKIAALRHLPDHDAFFQFFGIAKDVANVARYHALLRPRLDDATRRFWDQRTLLGQRRIAFFAKGLYHKALLGRFIGFLHGFAHLLGHHPSRMLAARDLARLYRDRVRHLACDFALSENYFAWQAFGRRYGSGSGSAASLPPYLQPDNYDTIR